MREKGVRRLEHHVDAALADPVKERGRLVAAEVEETDCCGATLEVSQNGPKHLHLLLPRRPGRRLEEQQLGPHQADAFGALSRRLFQLGDGGRVGQHANAPAVSRLGGLEPACQCRLARQQTSLGVRCGRGDAPGVGSPHHDAAVAVDHNLFPIFDVEQIASQADDHRQAEGSGHDRGVGGDAASREGDPLRGCRELSHVGRAETRRDEDSVFGCASGFTGGKHSRAAVGVASLPLAAPVEVDLILEVE